MVKTESEIRLRIKELELKLQENENIYKLLSDEYLKRKMLMQSFNIESQLDALYFVLGESYAYKYL